MQHVNIICDGGLGNRFNSLLGGLWLCKILDASPILWWPIKNNCACEFNDIFSNDLPVVTKHTNTIYDNYQNFFFLAHTKLIDQIPNNHLHPHNKTNIYNSILTSKDIVYMHNKLERYIDDEIFYDQLCSLNIQNNILERVLNFCRDNKINRKIKGIHIRKTDGALRFDEDKMLEHIKNTKKITYFVCSDDKETEDRFNTLKNVIINPKQNFVEKLTGGSWRTNVIDSEGRKSKYNIMRSKEAIIEGFIDMLILSRTNIIVNNKSSFLGFAKRYSNIDLTGE